jgi:hypothetical protein
MFVLSRFVYSFVIKIFFLKTQDCNLGFYLTDPYIDHIAEHIKDPEIRKIAQNDLKEFERKIQSNEIGLYQCYFCEYGSNYRGEDF